MSRMCRLAGSGAAGSYEGFAHDGEQAGQRDGLAGGGPRRSIHADEELGAGVWRPEKQALEAFISEVVLNRNLQVRLHKVMKMRTFTKVNCARGRARSEG
jgi:hypothetical protein